MDTLIWSLGIILLRDRNQQTIHDGAGDHRNNSTCASGYYIDTHVLAVVADMNNHGHLDIVFGHGEQKQEPKLAIAGWSMPAADCISHRSESNGMQQQIPAARLKMRKEINWFLNK